MTAEIRSILRALTRRALVMGVARGALRTLEAVGLFYVALLGTSGSYLRGGLVATGLAGLLLAGGLLRGLMLGEARKVLFHKASAALLHGDLLGTPVLGHEAEPAILNGLFEALHVSVELIPVLLGDCTAATILTVLVARTQSVGLLGLATVPLAAGSLLLLHAHRQTRDAAEHEHQAFSRVADGFSSIARGRLEIVGNGQDAKFLDAHTEAIADWTRRALRSAIVAALGGRGPLVLASLVVGLVVFAGHEPADVVKAAIIMASAAPAFAGAARGVFQLARRAPRLQPLSEILETPAVVAWSTVTLPPLPAKIVCRGLTYAYPGKDAVLRDLHFEWEPGEVLVLEGPNGSGKSTCLRLLLGLGRPTRGEITVGGIDLLSLDLLAWRRHLAFVPQRPFLPEYATVREAVKLIARDAADHDIERAVTRVGLMSELQAASPGAPLNAPVAALSAGQRQRLALARALAKDTAILLLDEPDANLDQAGIDLIADIVRSMGGKAIAIAAHTPQIIRLGDRVLRLGERRSGI